METDAGKENPAKDYEVSCSDVQHRRVTDVSLA